MRLRYLSGLLLAASSIALQAQSGLRSPRTPLAPTPGHPAALGGAPVNDLCSSVTPQALAVGGTLIFNGTTTGATITGDYTPGTTLDGFDAPAVWHAFTIATCSNVRVDYCGTPSTYVDYWNVLSLDCPATDNLAVSFDYNTTDCPDGNPTVYFNDLPAGTYYYPVWMDEADAIGPYELEISATACSGGPTGPVNDNCASVTPQALAIGTTLTFAGDNTGATTTGDFVSDTLFLDAPVVWHAFTTTACADVTLSYCGQPSTWENSFGFLSTDCPADSLVPFSVRDSVSCGDGNLIYQFTGLAGGTYYVPVLYDPLHGAEGAYSIEVSAVACGGVVVPANDDCASVTPEPLMIDATLTFTGDNTGATSTGDFAAGSPFFGDPVVWHAFTTTECANVTVSYCGRTPSWDATLGLLSITCPADSTVLASALDDSTCTDGNVIYVFDTLAAGTYYLPVLLDAANNAEGPYIITVHAGPCDGTVLPNDTCTTVVPAVLAVGGSITLQGDNTNATDNEGLGYASVWEGFILTECAQVTLQYCGTVPAFGTIAQEIYSACPPVDPIVATSTLTDACGPDDSNISLVYDDLVPGTYYVPVLMEAGIAEGAYSITLSAVACAVPVANDECADARPIEVALPLGCDTASVAGDNTAATQGGTEPACGFPGSPLQDVWYSFNSGDNIEVTIAITAGTIVGQGIEVYPACDGNSIYCSIVDEPHVVVVEPQTAYLVRVYSFSDLGGAGTFSICVQGSPGTGVADGAKPGFGVFPNPADGDMTVVYSGEAADATIQLFDLSGRAAYTERTHLVNGQQRTLRLSGTLASGTYALRITTAFGRSEQRVVIK